MIGQKILEEWCILDNFSMHASSVSLSFVFVAPVCGKLPPERIPVDNWELGAETF